MGNTYPIKLCQITLRQAFVCFWLLVAIALSSCGGGNNGNGGNANNNPPSGITTLTVRTFIENSTTPASDNVNIIINGTEEGMTIADGTLTLDVDAGATTIQAFIPSRLGATKTVTLVSDQDTTVDIVLTGEGLIADSSLVIDERVTSVQGNIIDQNFTSFTLRFLDTDNSTVAIEDVDDVSIRPADGGMPVYLLEFFELAADGSIKATDLDSVRAALLAVQGEVTLQVHGDGEDGRTYEKSIKFHIGRFTINGILSAPPSNPVLSVANLVVKATLLTLSDNVTVFETTSDALGLFTLSNIPVGTLSFAVTTQQNGTVYNGFGTSPIDGNKNVTINLLTTEDVTNGVPNLLVTDAPTVTSASSPLPVRDIITNGSVQKRISPSVFTEPIFYINAVSADVSVSGGSKDVRVTQSSTLDVPAGTDKITLKYKVSTAEYPTYVENQSQFDDVWELKVLEKNGGLLYAITSRVNTQLNYPPRWQTDGTTGDIIEEFNISATTDTGITLFAASTNIGDGAFATTVTASLSFEPDFRIKEITPDTVVPTKSDSAYYSIPRQGLAPGNANVNHRSFTLTLAGLPDGATIETVTAELFQESPPSNFMTLVNQGPDGVIVKQIDPKTLEVRVTTGNSQLDTDPPPFDKLGYRFTVTANINGTAVTTPQKESGRRLALWRMPEGIPRVGDRPPDGPLDDGSYDDWARKGTYEWIQANLSLLTAINDISGEHARNIGHETHARGTDIDMYHFTHLLGSAPQVGDPNYGKVMQLTLDGLNCQVDISCTTPQLDAIIAELSDWMTTARTKLTALTALSTVAEIIFAKGGKEKPQNNVLPNGWLKFLLRTGKITDTLGRPLELGIGDWSNGQVRHQNDHNNHVHIDLNDTALNNSP